MKIFYVTLLIMISITNAQASFGWFLLGAASSGNKIVAPKTELEIQINQISNKLPLKCADSVYTSCWNQYSYDQKVLHVAPAKSSEVLAYFENMGYDVVLKENQLIFNFKKEHEKYLAHQKVLISYEGFVTLIVFGSILGAVLYKLRKIHVRMNKIIEYYNNNPKAITFAKEDESKFKESLSRRRIPSGWIVDLDDTKREISRIGYYNGRTVGSIAWNSEATSKNLRYMMGKIKKEQGEK